VGSSHRLYTSRLAADVLKTSYLRDANESRIYFVLVWGLVALGSVILGAASTSPWSCWSSRP